jgi:dienelactone hydrolase
MAEKPEKFDSGGVSIPIEVFAPKTPSPHPAVLIVHGSAGLGAKYRGDIVSFADALAAKGILAMMPHYFASTRMSSDADGFNLIATHAPTWVKTCHDALAFMSRDKRCDASRLGVLGFSFGAYVTLSLGLAPPSGVTLRALVDFFGPTTSLPSSSPWASLPQLQIHHGDDDTVVFPSDTKHLIAKLEGAGKRQPRDFIVRWYDKQGHVFDAPSLTKARKETIQFFEQKL